MDWLVVEWLILILVTPIVITAVVLLYGFVGCGELLASAADAAPTAPTNLAAKGAGPNSVALTWQDTAGTGVTFSAVRREAGTNKTDTFAAGSGTQFNDQTGLVEGTTYFYTVQATLGTETSAPSNSSAATTFPEAPADVNPRPTDVNRIDLTWTNKSTRATHVVVEHETPTGKQETKHDANVPQPLPFIVQEGTEHKFRVFASMEGFEANVTKDIRSLQLPLQRVKPLAFKAVLPNPEPPPTLAGYCIVQRLASALLKNSGSQVWLTVSPPSVGSLKINRIYISQPDPAADAWDSAGAPTKVIDIDTAAAEQLSLTPADPPRRLGPIAFNLNQANDLLIAFDFSATDGDCLYAEPLAGATAYYKDAAQQAATADRSPNAADPAGTFLPIPDRHYLITEIEVL